MSPDERETTRGSRATGAVPPRDVAHRANPEDVNDNAEQSAPDSIVGAISRHMRAADTSWVVAGSLVGGLCAYLFQVVGTRGLGEDAFAPIGVLWTIQYLILSIPMLSLEAWVTRETGLGHDIASGLRAAVLAMSGLAVLVGVVCVVFADALFGGTVDFGIVAGILVLAFGGFVIARGYFAGSERFKAYGTSTGGESLLRLVLLVVVLAIFGTARSIAWVLPVGPALVAIGWLRTRTGPFNERNGDSRGAALSEPVPGPPAERNAAPFDAAEVDAAHRTDDSGPVDVDAPFDAAGPGLQSRSGGFLAATTVANAAAQLLLAGGPLFLVALGAGAVEISIFFVTITAARTPLVFAIGGVLSRLLPPLTRVVGRGDRHALHRLTAIAIGATVVGATVAASAAALLGPQVVALFFGQGFRPDRYFVTLTAAAAVLATGNLTLNQIMIALRAERHLPIPWLVGLGTAVALTLFVGGTATTRVITGLVLGEVLVLLGLAMTVAWRSSDRYLTVHRADPVAL